MINKSFLFFVVVFECYVGNLIASDTRFCEIRQRQNTVNASEVNEEVLCSCGLILMSNGEHRVENVHLPLIVKNGRLEICDDLGGGIQ